MWNNRPYISYYIYDLEELFEKNQKNLAVLEKIYNELEHRADRVRNLRLKLQVLTNIVEIKNGNSVETTQITNEHQLVLYEWQKEALDAWANNHHRGIVEAVTGAGKTHVALEAMLQHLALGFKVVILVPNITLLDQWYKKVMAVIPKSYVVNKMGGSNALNAVCDVLIAVINSAAVYQLLEEGKQGLLIADECHRYGSESWSAALELGFNRRLGLTATLERTDDGVDDYILPYFERSVYQLGYLGALDEKVISDFKLAFIGVTFSGEEQELYTQLDNECKKLMGKLINSFNVSAAPFGKYMQDVQNLSNRSGIDFKGTILARKYLSAFSRRKELVARAHQKFDALRDLKPSIKQAERTIIFTQTKEAAEEAVKVLRITGVSAAAIHSSLNKSERIKVLTEFQNGQIECVVSPKILDEGVDVPAADLGIIFASSKSRRQLIQRMGRVIRKKEDGRLARIVMLYVKETMEDPDNGAIGTFIEVVEDAATDLETFDSSEKEEIVTYLNDFKPAYFDWIED